MRVTCVEQEGSEDCSMDKLAFRYHHGKAGLSVRAGTTMALARHLMEVVFLPVVAVMQSFLELKTRIKSPTRQLAVKSNRTVLLSKCCGFLT